jgi:hypothetical protein
VGAALYDPDSGVAIFPLPRAAARIPAGRTRAVLTAADFQEAKNVNSVGDQILPNTAFRRVAITAVSGPALTWVAPPANECVGRSAGLVVVASSTTRIRSVRFFADGRRIGVDRSGTAGVFTSSWGTRLARTGRHELTAVATDAGGRALSATRDVRVCH